MPSPAVPVLIALLTCACAPPSLHIAPAHQGMDRKEVAVLDRVSAPVLDRRTMMLLRVDEVPVHSFAQVYLSAGWHFFEYGYSEQAGCRKYQHTQVYVDYGVGKVRDPSRDRVICLEPVIEEHVFSGWFLMAAGGRYRWTELQSLLKEFPDSRDPSPYDRSVRGVPYKKQ